MMPYGQPGISSTINYVRLARRYQMLNDGDDGVLLVRLGTVVTQMMPYRQSEISLTINYVRLARRYQMLNDGDDGVLPVRPEPL